MTVDSRRKLAFMSRDSGQKGQIIIDLKDPWNPKLINFSKNFQGHTSTCLNDCRFMWSVGGVQGAGAGNAVQALVGLRDRHARPAAPVRLPDDLRRRRLRAPAPTAARRTPSTSTSTASPGSPARRRARLLDRGPAQGPDDGPGPLRAPRMTRSPTRAAASPAQRSSFMHNAYRLPTSLGDGPAGDTMLITNEANSTDCTDAGVFIVASLKGMLRRHGHARSRGHAPMQRLAAYRTAGKPGEFHGTRHHVPTPTASPSPRPSATARRTGSRSRATSSRSATTSRARASSTSRTREPAAGRLVPRPGPRRTAANTPARSSPATPRAPTGTASTSTSPTTSAASTSSSSTTPRCAARSSRRRAGTPARTRQSVEAINDQHRRRRRRHRAGHAVADAGHAGRVRRVHAGRREGLRGLARRPTSSRPRVTAR